MLRISKQLKLETHQVLSMRIELTPRVVSRDVDECLVDEAGEHDIIGRSEQLDALQRARRHNPRAMSGL